jgi:hypothetical protein
MVRNERTDGGSTKTGLSRQLRIGNCGLNAKAPSRQVAKAFHSLQCNIGKLRIFGKVFPPLFSLCAPVQILWLRLAALRRCVFALYSSCELRIGQMAAGRAIPACRDSSLFPISGFLRFLLSARAKGAQRWSCSNLPISAFPADGGLCANPRFELF